MKNFKYIAGIDEAGRGPIAGPVAVGIFVAPKDFDFSKLPNLNDSKKLSAKQREEIFSIIKVLADKNEVKFAVSLISEKIIDKDGISKAVRLGIEECIKKINLDCKETFIYLDGLLKAPGEFAQETVIKGDEKIPQISAASICAKVLRDEFMINLSKQFPEYGFDKHKGYGTKGHYEALSEKGVSEVHRKTFLIKT